MAIGMTFPRLLCLLLAFRGSLAATCTHPGEECTEDISEDTSVLLQNHALGFQIDQTQHGDIDFEEEEDSIEDDMDLYLDFEMESMIVGNGSRQACFKCTHSREGRKELITECKGEKVQNATGLGPRQIARLRRKQYVACVKTKLAEKCKDECTYGSPCDQCKRAVSRADLKDVTKKCAAKRSAALKELCADSCSVSRNFHLLEYDEGDDIEASSSEERDLNATGPIGPNCLWCNQKARRGTNPDCLWCIRRDHNFGVLKECTKKFPGNIFGPLPESEQTPDAQKNWLKCWGDTVWGKCKDRCTFGADGSKDGTPDSCMQCKREVIIKKEDRVIRVDEASCLDAGRATFCTDECSESLVEQ